MHWRFAWISGNPCNISLQKEPPLWTPRPWARRPKATKGTAEVTKSRRICNGVGFGTSPPAHLRISEETQPGNRFTPNNHGNFPWLFENPNLFCGNTFQIILFHVRAESSKSSKSLLKDRALVSRAGARKVCCNPRAKQARPAWKSGMAQRRDGSEALSPALEPWGWELNKNAGGLGGSRCSPSSKWRSWLQVQYIYIVYI